MTIKKKVAAIVMASTLATMAPAAFTDTAADAAQAEVIAAVEALTDAQKEALDRCLEIKAKIDETVQARSGASLIERLSIQSTLRQEVAKYNDRHCTELFGLQGYVA